MKCSKCNGTGILYNALGDFEEDCGYCHGKGNVAEPHTNEEWFCSLSAEEKAKFFKNFNPCDKCPARKICDTIRNCENSFLEWLKEEHKE